MVTYYVKQGEVYKVSATETCYVYDSEGETVQTCAANSFVTFNAPTKKIVLSSDSAVLTCLSEVSGDLSGLTEHVNNSSIHTTPNDKSRWNNIVNDLSDVENHIEDSDIHVTSNEKASWNDIYSSLRTHINDTTKHVSENNKTELVGEIKNYSGTSVPDGYLLCDGSAVSRTTYAKLFAVIGTTWGTGDGSSTFNLPNLIDRVIWGASTAGEYLEAGLPNITGSFVVKDANGNPAAIKNATGATSTNEAASRTMGLYYNSGSYIASDTVMFDASKSNTIYGSSETVQPPAAKLMPIIKY